MPKYLFSPTFSDSFTPTNKNKMKYLKNRKKEVQHKDFPGGHPS